MILFAVAANAFFYCTYMQQKLTFKDLEYLGQGK